METNKKQLNWPAWLLKYKSLNLHDMLVKFDMYYDQFDGVLIYKDKKHVDKILSAYIESFIKEIINSTAASARGPEVIGKLESIQLICDNQLYIMARDMLLTPKSQILRIIGNKIYWFEKNNIQSKIKCVTELLAEDPEMVNHLKFDKE